MTDELPSVSYYGEVFSTSGYGTAARAYVRALHAAGVRASLSYPGRPPDKIEDDLVRSLIGENPDADFHIVHAIPSFWPRWAYTTSNVVAVTVWEANPIPGIWSRALSRAIDVWVPCQFNVGSFEKILGRAPFVLPYPLPWVNHQPFATGTDFRLSLNASDFVFYSIFDWQHRKNPEGIMQAFLEAFPEECDALLLLKTIAAAAGEARTILEELRSRTGSKGRIVLRCETFDDTLIDALHDRADCYVSLHRGEGWGYPLFEAAARGKPVVASAQGGPLDFLDPRAHRLVRCTEQAIQKPYFLFSPRMTWGEPDVTEAATALRWVYENREEARADAARAAVALRDEYSFRRIGEAALERLLQLRSERV